jgi:hypothetical protein
MTKLFGLRSTGAAAAMHKELVSRLTPLRAATEPEQLTALGGRLHDAELVRACLTILCGHEAWRERVAASSYEHPNGFDKLPVVVLADGSKWVLHVWWPSAEARLADHDHIHSHRWNFSSLLLAGALTHTEFVADDDGAELFEYRYESPESTGRYRMTPVGRARFAPQFSCRLTAGAIASYAPELLHRACVDLDSPVITMVAQGPAVHATTRVLTSSPILGPADVPVAAISADRLLEKLQRLLEVLA